MNEALQTLEVKVENNGTTPQGKIFAREWNVMVEAVKALDLKEFDEAKLLQYLRDNDFITSEDIPDVDFSNVVTLSGQQTIPGAKDFVGGIKVNGMPITYNAELGVWEFTGDLLVTGAVTMFGSLSGFQPSTVTEAVEVDGETIVKTKNSQGQWQLTAIGGGSGSGGGISAAEVNILISNALEPYALSTSIPTDNKQLSNGAGYATVSDLDTRINNLINGAPAAYDTLKEIADVLAGNVNSIGDILTALDTKATKTYVDTELTKYVKLATAQPIDAQHNFVNGLQIGGLPITKSASANNTIYLDANLVVSGAIMMFGSGSTTFPTIWANIPFDLNTMEWTGSVWRVKGGGSGSLDTNAVNVLISEYLTQNSYATISDISSALVGYATQSWVGDNYLAKSGGTISFGNSNSLLTVKSTGGAWSGIKYESATEGGYIGVHQGEPVYIPQDMSRIINIIHSANIKSTLGISDWALAATKPSYTAAEVGAVVYSEDIAIGNHSSYSHIGYGYRSGGWISDGPAMAFGANANYNHQLQFSNDLSSTIYHRTIAAGVQGEWATVIDSNNIGSQRVDYANLAGNADSANIATRFESVSLGITDLNEYKNTGAYNFYSSVNAPNSYISNMLVLRYSSDWGSQIVFDSEKNIFVRNWRDSGGVFDTNWRTVAFTDSNVASADVLKKSFANEDINYGAGDGLKLIYCHGNPGSYATAYQSGISVLTDYAGWQLTSCGGDVENPYFRSLQDNGVWKPWRQLAFLDSDVLSPSSGLLTVNGNLLTTGVITTPQINIGGLAAYKLQDDTLFIDANVVVRGAISMFGVNTLSEMESIEQRLLSLEQKVEQLSA